MRRIAGTGPNVFVNGRPLAAQVSWGDLHIIDSWPYGCWEMSWGVVVKPYQRPPVLAPGALVEARIGSGVRWSGTLSQPDWDSGQMIALGLARQAEGAIALNSGLTATTSTPDAAIDAAITRKVLTWVRRSSLSAVPFAFTDATPSANYITALLDVWATSQSKRWGVNAAGEVYAAADPTSPSFALRPGVGELGLSAVQVGRLYGAYQNLSGAYSIVSVGTGAPEVGVSLVAYGAIDSTKATAIITGIYNAVQPTASWSNGVTVTADQVATLGGQEIGLEQVVAGKMGRLLGLRDDRNVVVTPQAPPGGLIPTVYLTGGPVAATDAVLGRTDWDVSGAQVGITLVNTDDQTLAGAITAAGGELLS